MTKLHRVEVQIEAPKADFPGRTVQGMYTFEDGVVTLVDHVGNVVRDRDGKTYSEKVENGADHRQIAGRLTKACRKARRGEKVEGFSRKLHYPDLGFI